MPKPRRLNEFCQLQSLLNDGFLTMATWLTKYRPLKTAMVNILTYPEVNLFDLYHTEIIHHWTTTNTPQFNDN